MIDQETHIVPLVNIKLHWYLSGVLNVPFDRKKVFDASGNYDLLGIVRPLTALSFKGRLFLSGHYGSIKTS